MVSDLKKIEMFLQYFQFCNFEQCKINCFFVWSSLFYDKGLLQRHFFLGNFKLKLYCSSALPLFCLFDGWIPRTGRDLQQRNCRRESSTCVTWLAFLTVVNGCCCWIMNQEVEKTKKNKRPAAAAFVRPSVRSFVF